jgi:hypothetical protein
MRSGLRVIEKRAAPVTVRTLLSGRQTRAKCGFQRPENAKTGKNRRFPEKTEENCGKHVFFD